MTIYHVENFSTWQSVMWRISPHDNLLCKEISPNDKKNLHMHRLWCLWQISGMLGGSSDPEPGITFHPLRFLFVYQIQIILDNILSVKIILLFSCYLWWVYEWKYDIHIYPYLQMILKSESADIHLFVWIVTYLVTMNSGANKICWMIIYAVKQHR